MASNWFNERQPTAAPSNYGFQQPNQRASRIYGDQDVHYNEDGRLVVPGQVSGDRPTNMLFWRGGASPLAAADFDPSGPANNFRYRPWSRTVIAGPGADQAAAPIITRRIDRFGAPNEAQYAGGRAMALPQPGASASSAAATKSIATTMTPETIIVEEMRVYDKKPCGWILFMVVGLALLGLGITNGILCFQYHSYCFIWTGVFITVFAFLCVIHRGDYIERKWKSWLVIIVGFVTTILISACLYLLLLDYCHQVIELAQFTSSSSLDYYISVMQYRYTFYNITPMVLINNDLKYNIWTCFSLDTLAIVLLFLACGVLSTTLYVIDRFYNSHFVITKKVEPFCDPWLFNPWSQSSVGQAMVIVGCVAGSSQYGIGNTYNSWAIYYAPVWAGVLPVIAGIVSALALKNCGARQRNLVRFAALIQLLSAIASIVAIVLNTLLLADNINTLLQPLGVVMVITAWSQNMIVASAILESTSDAICLVNVCFSLVLCVRLVACLRSNNKSEPTDSEKYILGEESENSSPSPNKPGLTQAPVVGNAASPQQPKPVNPTDMPMFQPYRPMGMRSYWIR